jgi:hypothetical protein
MSDIDTTSNTDSSAQLEAQTAAPSKRDQLVDSYNKAKALYFTAKEAYESELVASMAELQDKHGIMALEVQYNEAKKKAMSILIKEPSRVEQVKKARESAREARQKLTDLTAENAQAKRRLAQMRLSVSELANQLKDSPTDADLKTNFDAAKKALASEEVSRKEVHIRLKAAKEVVAAATKASADARRA